MRFQREIFSEIDLNFAYVLVHKSYKNMFSAFNISVSTLGFSNRQACSIPPTLIDIRMLDFFRKSIVLRL